MGEVPDFEKYIVGVAEISLNGKHFSDAIQAAGTSREVPVPGL